MEQQNDIGLQGGRMFLIIGVCLCLFAMCSCHGSIDEGDEINSIDYVNLPNHKYRIILDNGVSYYTNDSILKPGDKVKIVKQ